MAKNKPKILYIITQGTWGGAQRYVFDLAANLTNDFDITVAIGEKDGKKDLQKKIEGLKDYKINIVQLQHLVRRISPIHDILAIFELAKLYKKLRPDIIHLNSSKAGIIGSIAKLMAYSLQLTAVYTVHGWVFNEPLSWLRKKLYQFLEKLTARWKDKTIVLSEQDKKTAQDKLKIKPKKLSLIPLGIKTPEKILTKEEAQKQIVQLSNCPIVNDCIWIGTIAGLYKTKGLDILIEAISKINNLQSSIFNLQFIIIGDGPEKNNLQSKIQNLQLDNVHLLGQIENASQYLPAFDLFVLPSRKEGLPYTLLEAINHQIPIIATKVGGVPSLIEHQKTGILVKPESPEELAQAIINSLKNKTELQNYTALAFAESKKRILPKMLKKTIGLYRSLLN